MIDNSTLKSLQFPIGKFLMPSEPIKINQIKKWANEIYEFPKLLELETKSLTEEVLHWKYRPDGWNIKQLVHHCADSHMNSFIRF